MELPTQKYSPNRNFTHHLPRIWFIFVSRIWTERSAFFLLRNNPQFCCTWFLAFFFEIRKKKKHTNFTPMEFHPKNTSTFSEGKFDPPLRDQRSGVRRLSDCVTVPHLLGSSPCPGRCKVTLLRNLRSFVADQQNRTNGIECNRTNTYNYHDRIRIIIMMI